jgi:hypothetical protein
VCEEQLSASLKQAVTQRGSGKRGVHRLSEANGRGSGEMQGGAYRGAGGGEPEGFVVEAVPFVHRWFLGGIG